MSDDSAGRQDSRHRQTARPSRLPSSTHSHRCRQIGFEIDSDGVDGDKFNAGISDGVTSKELAGMMIMAGCSDALNFDGGGSSTIYSETLGTLNRPSDGNLRKVRNGWFLTAPKTTDATSHRLRLPTTRRNLTSTTRSDLSSMDTTATVISSTPTLQDTGCRALPEMESRFPTIRFRSKPQATIVLKRLSALKRRQ